MDRLIHRIANMLALGVTQEQAHDSVVGPEVSEEEFFLAYQAAQLLCPIPSTREVSP